VSPASGSGPGSVTVSWTANTGTSTRSGTVTIATKTFTVTQPGATSPTLSIGAASGPKGTQICVNLTLANNGTPVITAMEMNILYDSSALTPVSLTSPYSKMFSIVYPGKVRLGIWDQSSPLQPIPDGVVGTLCFNSIGTACAQYSLTFEPGSLNGSDANSQSVAMTGVPGSITTTECGCVISSCTATVPASAQPGSSVSFQATAQTSNCSGTLSYSWVFGDGVSSTLQNATHTYASAGTYHWSMTVSAPGVSCLKVGTIIISPCKVTCSATVPATGAQGVPASFQATATAVNCTGSAAFSWDFGDGQTSNLQNPTHTYINGGVFVWTVTATVQGVPDTESGSITIGGCSLSCTATVQATGSPGSPISFNATAAPAGCTGTPSFAWTFGDGASSTSQNATHSYPLAGTYTWSMTTMVQGVSCVKGGSIVVSTSACCAPDVSCDGSVNVVDMVKVQRVILGLDAVESCPRCDVNRDNAVNVLDMIKIQRVILGLDVCQ
jgi:PKD repeat protein